MSYRQEVLRYAARLAACCLLLGLLPAWAEVQVIPQVADGAGWSTTIVLSNKTTTAQSVTLNFYRGIDENGTTEAWTPPFLESVSRPTFNLAAGSSLFLHTPGTAGALSQGWGELNAAAGVAGYAVFTSQGQDATAPAVMAAGRILVPFDNTSNLVTAIAVANPNDSAETIKVNIKTSDGATITGALPQMPARGHRAVVLPDQFAETKGKRGLAEFYVASGSFSIIALRFNPTSAFTSAPVYSQTGAPVIGAVVTNAPGTFGRTQVIPQVADGGNWSTTIVLTNTTTANLRGSLIFRTSISGGGGVTVPWYPAFLENVSPSALSIPAGSTMFLQTPGTVGYGTQGYAELRAEAGVEGYAIFTSRAAGKAQDGTAPAVYASNRLLVPFDNAPGLVTALAIVNPTIFARPVTVRVRTSDGTRNPDAGFDLPAEGHIAIVMPALFPETAGKRGLAEFYASTEIALIALRFSGSGAFASAPAYFESGAPIITTNSGGGSGGGGGGGNPAASSITSPTPGGALKAISVTFRWTAVTEATEYVLQIGTAEGKSDLYYQNTGTGLAATPSGLPKDGRTLYVRISWKIGESWYSTAYTYLSFYSTVADLGGGVVMPFVQIQPGEFMRGCSPGDGVCFSSAIPQHMVRITKRFQMGMFEVTQAQWQSVMGSNPSRVGFALGPVEQISWNDTQRFLQTLNARNDGYRYRLPTDAEWEYAARAGTTGPRYGDPDTIAWYSSNSPLFPQPVGRKQPNAWGLYDMLGNVSEWVQDGIEFVKGAVVEYPSNTVTDPQGPEPNGVRVIKGGSWKNTSSNVVVFGRGSGFQYVVDDSLGFRIVRE